MHRKFRRLMQLPLGRDLDQITRDLANAVLQLRLAGLPSAAAQLVEFDARLLRAVARQQFDVLHRQIEFGIVGVVKFEAVVRRAGDFQRLQADIAANAVLDMDHEIAGRKRRDLGDEILDLAARLACAHETVAENVLLGDEREALGLETGLETDHRKHGLVARGCLHHPPGVDVSQRDELVVLEHARHALAGAFAP